MSVSFVCGADHAEASNRDEEKTPLLVHHHQTANNATNEDKNTPIVIAMTFSIRPIVQHFNSRGGGKGEALNYQSARRMQALFFDV